MLAESQRIPPATLSQIRDPKNKIYVSAVSIWEILQKHCIGKLELPADADRYLVEKRKELRVNSLPFDEEAARWLSKIPLHHRDPFDRMIICLALSHGMSVVTSDSFFSEYDVTVVW